MAGLGTGADRIRASSGWTESTGSFLLRFHLMGDGMKQPRHPVHAMSFARVYPLYVAKAEKKGRTKAEVDEIIRWLTGYSQKELQAQLKRKTDIAGFLADAPQMNPSRALIKGVVCGVRVEKIEERTMRDLRCLDLLIDELARGKAMEKILRR